MAFHVKISDFEVRTDTPDEVLDLVEVAKTRSLVVAPSQPALSPRQDSKPLALSPMEPKKAAPAAPATSVERAPRTGKRDLVGNLRLLQKYWPSLTPRLRQAVELRAGEGLDIATVAARMSNSPKSVSVALNIARRRLELMAASEGAGVSSDETVAAGGDDGDDVGDDDVDPEPEPEPEPEVEVDLPDVPELAELSGGSPGGGPVISDLMLRYLQEVRRHPILSREEEHEIATEYQRTRDPKLARKLVESNLRFVVSFALKFKNERKNLLDLVQEGNVGLVHAVDKFNPDRGLRFLTYARYWIQAYMMKHIMKNRRLVVIGTTQPQRKLFWQLRRVAAKLEAEEGVATPERIAEVTGVKVNVVVEMQSRLASNEATIERRSEDGSNHDWLVDESPRPDELYERKEMVALLDREISELGGGLDPRMVDIMKRRILAEDPEELRQIGDDYGVTRERIRQLEERLKKRLGMKLRDTA